MAPRWGGLRPEPYDPDARDADNDGVVQEGTAWERPAGTNLLDEAGQAIERGSNSSTRPRGMRVVGGNGKPVDYTPTYERPGARAAGGTTVGGTVSPLGDHGTRSLKERGVPSVREAAAPQPVAAPPVEAAPTEVLSVRERIKKKNAEVLGRIAERGGAWGRITQGYKGKNKGKPGHSIQTPEEYAKLRREAMKDDLDAFKFFLSTGKAPQKYNGYEGVEKEYGLIQAWEQRRDALHPDLVQHIIDTDSDDLIAEMEASALAFHQGIDKSIRVRIKPDAVFGMLEDGVYRTTHDDQAIGPMSDEAVRRSYEESLGLPEGVEAGSRPASGYVTHEALVEYAKELFEKKNGRPPTEFDILQFTEGDATPYGHIEMILHPEVAERSVYGRGDSLNNSSRPALMEDATDLEIMNALLGCNNGEKSLNLPQGLAYLEASRTDDFSRITNPKAVWEGWDGEDPYDRPRLDTKYIEALVSGSFDTSEIKEVKVGPQGRIPSVEVTKATIAEFYSPEGLRSAGMTEEEIAFISENGLIPKLGSTSNAEKYPGGKWIAEVTEIRMAKQLEDQFLAAGAERVIQLHPKGVDIMDVENYGSAKSLGDTPEEIRVALARKEIVETLRSRIDSRKNPTSGGLDV
jgi:hypothetical protein